MNLGTVVTEASSSTRGGALRNRERLIVDRTRWMVRQAPTGRVGNRLITSQADASDVEDDHERCRSHLHEAVPRRPRSSGAEARNVNVQRMVFARLYRRAPAVEALAWHREAPPDLLAQAVSQRPTPGRALDLGCGGGAYSVYLAQHGYSVVAIDFVPAAVKAARARAEQAGVDIEVLEGDVPSYDAPSPFDVVLDSGCLHHLPGPKVSAYRRRLDDWLAPGGDYVLVHFAHRPRLPIPMGPRHLTRDDAVRLFAPLELQAYDETEFDVPLPMGPMRAGVYWFKRPSS